MKWNPKTWSPDHDLLVKAGKLIANSLVSRAREDPSAFIEYAFPHEKTGAPIHNEDFHLEWQRFLSSHDWAIISASVEFGKTVQLMGRIIWEIGRDPTLRCAWIGANDEASEKALSAIRRHIDRNPRVREVFPDLRKTGVRGDPWNDRDIRVHGATLSRDPTIQARSVGSRNLLGSRLDLVVIDDLLGFDNTRTQLARDKLEAWFDDVLFTRVADDWEALDYGRIWFIGNPWDVDDLRARLAARPGWAAMTTSAVHNPDDPPEVWRPSWPRQWPIERLLKRRAGMLAQSFSRKYLCRILDSSQRRFKLAWLNYMFELGKGRILLDRQPYGRDGVPLPCFTGLDPAMGEKDTDAESCLFTIAVDPFLERRIVIDCQAGRWDGPELLDRCSKVSEQFHSELVVESNQAQRWMAQFSAQRGIRVRTFHTGAHNKWSEEYGVESLAIEMKNGQWIAPSGPSGTDRPPELMLWARELYDYDPSSHTGDRVMASWLAREGARQFLLPRVRASTHLRR